MTRDSALEGLLLDERVELSLAELARACATDAEWLLSLVDEGILEPRGRGLPQWRFSAICIQRVRRVKRLQQDLGIDLPGSALALELLDEIERLRRRLEILESRFLDNDPELR